MTYDMKLWTLTLRSANKLRTIQKATARIMLEGSLRNHMETERKKTKVDDILEYIARQKWIWMVHVARQRNERWTK